MTHLELVTETREFYPHGTNFFSPILKMLPHHRKRLRDRLLNVNKTLMELTPRTTLATNNIVYKIH